MARKGNNSTNDTPDEKPVGRDTSPQPKKPRSKVEKGMSDVITGDILFNERIKRWYPLALYVIFLIFLYIGHNFNHQRLQRIEMQQRLELNDERSRSLIFSSMRLNASRHSTVTEEVRRRGLNLVEPIVPPKKAAER